MNDFDKLSELLVCDRIKSTLSESCLRYVLFIESASDVGWLSLQSLTESIDRYLAAHSANDKPKAYYRTKCAQSRSCFDRFTE